LRKSVLLPRLKARRDCELSAVATATGRNATSTGSRFGFASATTDYHQVLNDPEIDAVIIATRHQSHSQIASAAIRGGKGRSGRKAACHRSGRTGSSFGARSEADGRILVGYNRRYASLVIEMKKFLTDIGSAPLALNYRVNAGRILPASWIQGDEGGGRIIGECGHFIDLIAVADWSRSGRSPRRAPP
jgi:predicted dehydrogenase